MSPSTREIERTRHLWQHPLVAVLAAGAAAVWLCIPLLSLWVLSQASDSYPTIYLGALLVSGPAMAAWGWCLHRISQDPRFLRLSAGIAVTGAALLFVVWVLFFGAHGNGAAPGAW
jgi:hypothetical protein